jgi:cytochrome c
MRIQFIVVLMWLCCIPLSSRAAAIHDAAKKNDIAGIVAALDGGADVNESDRVGTPLYIATIRGNLDAARFLVEHGADVNMPNEFGTPLHAAAKVGCLACVKLLVEAGADLNALTPGREPALHFARKFGHSDVADYLFNNGYQVPAPPPISAMLNSADPVKGKTLFLRGGCGGCHDPSPDMQVRYGPPLWGIVGRPRASIAKFRYSQTLVEAGGNWNYEELNAFISDPRRVLPGTEMDAKGFQKPEDRADLIAFLRSLSDNPGMLPQQ